jgi:DNA polymerase
MPTDEQIESASDLSKLSELISNCQRCPLFKTKTKDVPGVGSQKAAVMFIGEAPGKEEDLIGEPFVGSAGKFLNEMLEDIGLPRNDVYIANVLKHRPPGNRDPDPSEVEACWPYLSRQIELISPRLIVFLGRHAMQRFFPAFSISKVHGQAFRRKWNGNDQVFLALGMRDTLKNDFGKIPKILDKIEKEQNTNEELNIKQEKLL